MNTKKLLPVAATAIAAAIALAGCGTAGGSGSSGTSMPGMDHGSSSSSPAAAADQNTADVMFAQMMIPHHAQAVEMSETILKKQDIPAEITALATRIKEAQGPEIEKMTGWLAGWGESTQTPAGHSMDGMMGADDMAKLDAAQGVEAAKLFLTQMIAHHQGAVTMARTETTDGKNPEAVQLSKDIVSAQEAEIQEMQKLLATL
ncbi:MULTISPECIES: DUF305 domain-containing protein [Paenarthrobacter]|uniref:DUF305 domain-containing protein n=1 Tax=Paenarthrobacter ureafaciens TaxID=37931 RepID=A0AAX3EJD1_PAEUR|nr:MULTISPECIES: DUF305 domain-containing protein [Paenarthrobacter]NKR13906.1 DUF305 domain-containing protein [Arthrobacter sp. M5]NKR17344.1 DUF305 domain-containing protein [Arthrobacter sp. M6]OEH58681.1 DUF305 domain-containing protein [Arthrobacter sp. D2]OEH61540.1 DUF305 domain-containing protein [Arthrobacter sp. D4]MDO5862994.1 DUF305 domain-containing protein [Paenarthrobacter sp. SD-2]